MHDVRPSGAARGSAIDRLGAPPPVGASGRKKLSFGW
jgi:hypothetical protein